MSAFIVSREHIRYMVEAADRFGSRYPGEQFSWYHGGTWHHLGHGPSSDYAGLGQLLWDENVKSVQYRYPGDRFKGDLPGPIGEDYLYSTHRHVARHPDPVQVLQAIRCYEYQSCEHPDWEASEARAVCKALTRAAISALPGFDDAAWEVNDAEQPTKKTVKAAALTHLDPRG